MLVIVDYIIGFQSYIAIGIIISILLMIYFIYIDFKNEDNIFTISTIIKDMSEGLILGLSWIISIPITAVTNIILSVIYMYCVWKEGDE